MEKWILTLLASLWGDILHTKLFRASRKNEQRTHDAQIIDTAKFLKTLRNYFDDYENGTVITIPMFMEEISIWTLGQMESVHKAKQVATLSELRLL